MVPIALLEQLMNVMTECYNILQALLHETAITNMNPATLWLAVEHSQVVCNDLCEPARTLLVMPASSAGI